MGLVAGMPAAVDGDAAAVDVLGLVAGEVDHQPGGVLGHAVVTQGDEAVEVGGGLLVLIDGVLLRGPNQVGGEAVETDAETSGHGGHVLGDQLGAGLGDGVSLAAAAHEAQRGGGGEVDEVALDAVLGHPLVHDLDGEAQAVEVDVEDVIPLLVGLAVEDVLVAGEGGRAVDDAVDGAVLLEGLLEDEVPGLALADVGSDGNSVAAVGDELGALGLDVGVDVDHDNLRALGAEELAGLVADAAVSAGDYAYFAFQSVHDKYPPYNVVSLCR